jgi:dTMP kinase
MENSGRFIVLEGIDGCGKGTQIKLLSEFLIKKGYVVEKKKYPEYGQPIGDLIHDFLYKRIQLNAIGEVLLHAADRLKDKEYIQDCVKNGKILLADRYYTTTLVYQYVKGIPLEKILKLSELFEMPKPDLSILIRISPETSLERKSKEKPGNLDRHEEDLHFQKSLAEMYDKIARENVFCPWAVVDGEKSIEEVFNQIINVLKM